MTLSDRNARTMLFFMDCPWLRAIACRKRGCIAIRDGRGNQKRQELKAKDLTQRALRSEHRGHRERGTERKASDPKSGRTLRLRVNLDYSFAGLRLSTFRRVVPFYIRYAWRPIAVRGSLRWDRGVAQLSCSKVNHEA
jgi:hypothetical protein